jgi:predicted membrane metal-binding protein
MSLTPGEMLFYGGIAGMAVVVISSVVMIAVSAGSRKRLRRKLNEEYGGNLK